MKNLIVLLFLISISCSQYKDTTTQKQPNKNEAEMYRVIKIDSINNFYLVYAKKNDTLYKIVSKKEQSDDCKKIKVNNQYKFKLISNRESAPIIRGIKIAPINVDCFAFDKETTICTEKDKGIYDLYFAKNIKGLCFTID